MMQDEIEKVEIEEEEDPVFVLTDEWRDFFAKSEAKRRLGLHDSPHLNVLLRKLKLISYSFVFMALQQRSRLRRGKIRKEKLC